jgi:hypothetical protein
MRHERRGGIGPVDKIWRAGVVHGGVGRARAAAGAAAGAASGAASGAAAGAAAGD